MTEKQDVVELLEQQHQQIRHLLDEVQNTKGEDRKQAFQRVSRLLAVHETAEEVVVHPYVRENVKGGDTLIEKRLVEENGAKDTLSRLEDMDPETPEFEELFSRLSQDVVAHADAEEEEEFPHLRRVTDTAALERLATAVKAAEAVAPTHPHPGTETPAKNVVLGPLASVMDRARDAAKAAMGKS